MRDDDTPLADDQDQPGSGDLGDGSPDESRGALGAFGGKAAASSVPPIPAPGGGLADDPADETAGQEDRQPGDDATDADDDDDDGLIDNLVDGAGEVAAKTGGVLGTMASTVVKQFYRYLVVIFLPIPVGFLARNQMAFRDIHDASGKGRLEFYSQPNFVTTIHLIWVGWLVGACELFNSVVQEKYQISGPIIHGLEWFWIVVLCLTVLVMGIMFGRVAAGFLLTTLMIIVLGLLLYQQMGDVEVLRRIAATLNKVDVDLGWGVPVVVSAVLGMTMLLSSIWQQLDDRWIVQHQGNFLEHENFQQKDRTIQKGAKTFIHGWPCLLRRFLLFGYGEIEVRDSRGLTEVERIEGIFWAKEVSELLKSKFQSTDVTVSQVVEEEEEGAS